MRFLLVDAVTKIEPGRRIEGVKNVSLADEALRGHFARRPLFPSTLVIESLLQLTGLCAVVRHEYRFLAVLSVLEDVRVPPDLPPGTRLDLFGELRGTNPKGSVGAAWALVGDERIASIGRVLFAHVPAPDPEALRCRLAAAKGLP